MGLAERMAQPVGPRGLSGKLCRAAKLFARMSEEDQAVFNDWLTMYRQDPKSSPISAVGMADHVSDEIGERVPTSTFDTHVRERCMCYDAR